MVLFNQQRDVILDFILIKELNYLLYSLTSSNPTKPFKYTSKSNNSLSSLLS